MHYFIYPQIKKRKEIKSGVLKTILNETLQAEVENTPSQDLLIVVGDLNAMVERVNMGNERVMG